MDEHPTERIDGNCYLFSLMVWAIFIRVLVGLVHPILNLEQTFITALTSVVFLSPTLYRACFREELLSTLRKRLVHTLAMVLAGGLFLYSVALSV